MKKFIPFLVFFTLLVVFTVPVAQAADGCSSAGSACTINNASGVCAQNPDTGDFYCRPSILDQPLSGFVALAPIPGLTDAANTSVVNSDSLANFFNNLYKYLIGLAAALAVIMIIWGGLEISTKDSVSKQSDGKERIYQAIIGLVLVLSPALVFSIINPAILNLSINLPALDTKSVPINTTSTTQDIQLSNTETQLRQSAGARVLYAFTLPSVGNMTPIQILQTVNSEQTKCTSAEGGPGIILPVTTSGGGTINYACQTCPSNTSVSLFSSCRRNGIGLITCGACQ